jgi:hypothetical protein
MSSVLDFNEKGNRIKEITFDDRGNPSEISVYGYLRGKRVVNSNTITYEYNPPPMFAAPTGRQAN